MADFADRKGVVAAWFERASPPFAPPAQDGCAISLPSSSAYSTIEPSVFFVAAAARREVLKYSTIRSEPNPEFLLLLLLRRRHCGLKITPFLSRSRGRIWLPTTTTFAVGGKEGDRKTLTSKCHLDLVRNNQLLSSPLPLLLAPPPSAMQCMMPPPLLVHIRRGGRGLGPISRRSWGGGEALSNLKEGEGKGLLLLRLLPRSA